MSKIVYLFLDTNVLEQCRPLRELDWSAWREFAEVHLIISRPVQSEIDDHKSKGGERLARKARKASSLIREIILSKETYPVRPTDPLVKLIVDAAIRPSPELSEILDFSRPDDQLIGIVHAFSRRQPGVDVRVLTHDTGPMASAQMVDVAIAPVPDAWLLPPEPSDAEKKSRLLEAEVARLKQTEPELRIACIDAEGKELDRLELEVRRYEPLVAAEILTLVEMLMHRFPLATDYGGREGAERAMVGAFGIRGLKEVFKPATDKEIKDYQEKYEQWLKECKALLGNLHMTLEKQDGQPQFAFTATNIGARPAKDVLITLQANGQFEIMPPPYRSDDEDKEETEDRRVASGEIPSPPTVPRGTWTNECTNTFDAFQQHYRSFGVATPLTSPVSAALLRSFHLPKPHDRNEFYYKPDRPSSPGPEFNLECAQWRHGLEPKIFEGQIHFRDVTNEISGSLECRVHAENLSEVVSKRIPVQIEITRVNVAEIARKMVELLR